MSDLAEQFLAVLRPNQRQPKHTIDDDEYGRFLLRAIRGWEARVINNPEMLAQNVLMAQRFSEIVNVAIAVNAERYAIDPRSAASMAECARILKISKPSASERRARGVAIMATRVEKAGAVKFSEAQREKEALTEARDHAVVSLAEYRARHAA